MLKIEKTEVYGWEAAIRGMRNPMNSWEKSDSLFFREDKGDVCTINDRRSASLDLVELGENDLALMMKLRNAGTDHRKFMRMIMVSFDITAPLYWWKEFDTYKVGTVANSCSTMHKIHDKEFTLDDFSHEHLYLDSEEMLKKVIKGLNAYREDFLDCTVSKYATADECKALKKEYWWQMIQMLPSSYNQKRTVMLNYEVLANIYKSRKNHKLDEWHTFCDWIESLPYSELITGGEGNG